MTTIKNKTPKPLSVPLPGGKKLFLSPGKSGQIATKSATHPALLALVESGELEIVGADSGFKDKGVSGGSNFSSSQTSNRGNNIRRRGDV